MPGPLEHLESFLGCTILSSLRGRDSKLFTKSPPFTHHPTATLHVSSPECGPSPSPLHIHHTPLAENRFPDLDWATAPSQATATATGSSSPTIEEYLLVVEDPDAPLPSPVVHGIYYAIPAHKTSLSRLDFTRAAAPGGNSSADADNLLAGGFRYGANRMKNVWGGPRPVLGHGEHRYFFQVVGLGERVDWDVGHDGALSLEEVKRRIAGKVVGWGVWVGTFERRIR